MVFDVKNEVKTSIAAVNTKEFAINNVAKMALMSAGFALLAAGCANKPMPAHTPVPPPPAPVVAPPPPPPAPPPPVVAAPPAIPQVASWADYRRRAAQFIMASNGGNTFAGKAPERWNGIATVTVYLNGDGTIKSLDMMRESKVAPHVNGLALAAARRVASFGSVANLPGPWQFNETFLYNDDNKFQLVTIVEGR